MANIQNLTPFPKGHRASPEVVRKGGINSQKVQKEKKTLRQIAEDLGNMEVSPKIIEQYQKMFPHLKPDTVAKTLMVAGAYSKAVMERDVKAMRFIAELKGETKNTEIIAPIQIVINGEDKNC